MADDRSLIEKAQENAADDDAVFGRADGPSQDRAMGDAFADPVEFAGDAEARADYGDPDLGGYDASRPQGVDLEVDFRKLESRGFLTPFNLDSPLAEEFRLLKRPIMRSAFSGSHRNRNVLMVTSARPREGKTFVSANMAISIAAEKDVHVLLVEADAMRPSIMASFGLPPGQMGLLDLLENPDMDPAEVIIRTNIGKLSVMPAGRDKAVAPELLSSDKMRRLTDEFASRYRDRIVIFDTPPLLAATEPSVLAQHVGQILFVVEAGRTSEIAVKAALDLISDHENVVLMLNKIHPMFDLSHFGRDGYYYNKSDKKNKKRQKRDAKARNRGGSRGRRAQAGRS